MPDRIITVSGACLALVAALLALPACSAMRVGAPIGNPLPMLTGDWTVQQIDGTDVAALLPAGLRPPTLSIAPDGSVSGFGGVNAYRSGLDVPSLASQGFSLDPVASTRMAGPPEAMRVESMLLEALGAATGFRIDGDRLSLTRGEQVLLRARR